MERASRLLLVVNESMVLLSTDKYHVCLLWLIYNDSTHGHKILEILEVAVDHDIRSDNKPIGYGAITLAQLRRDDLPVICHLTLEASLVQCFY